MSSPRIASNHVIVSWNHQSCESGERFFDRGTYDCRALSSFRPLAYWDSSLWALPALSNKEFRLGPGKRWQQQKGRGPCCASAPFLVNGAAGSASTKKERIHLR